MDDCDLEKLSVKPGKLSPAFHRNVTEYSITVGSDIDKLSLDPLTSDSGASYSISGSGGGKEVPLSEGVVTDIKIEVSAEDGTVKNYFIHTKRLSAKDATLADLVLDRGKLSPDFQPSVTTYTCLLPCSVLSVDITPTAPDAKNVVTVCGQKTGIACPVNVGQTVIEVEVTSPDGSNKRIYEITIVKKQLPRHVVFQNPDQNMEFECPISLSALYSPVTIRGSDPKHSFSGPIIDELTKTSKYDPLSELPLAKDWRIQDYSLEKKMAEAVCSVPLTYGGNSESVKFGVIGAEIEKMKSIPKVEDLKDKFKSSTESIKHTIQIRSWEKHLHQIFGETNVDQLMKNYHSELEKYFQSLPKPGRARQFAEGESPLDYLTNASHYVATAVKLKGKEANLHLQLGMVLEERYYAEDMFGLKKEEAPAIVSMNLQAKESSKEEECAAICKLRDVDATAPLALQLKAIDEEYHSLVDSGQSGKADHVQLLYAWRSKQAMQEGAAAQKAQDEESPLGQAYLKYMDALVADEAKAVYNFHAGRMLVILGNYTDAVSRLENALSWNPQHELSRYYLGLALALQKNGPGGRSKEAIGYLLKVMEILLTKNSVEAHTVKPLLQADNLVRSTNVHLLRGLIQLGKLLQQNTDIKSMTPGNVFHTAALLASQILRSVSRGDTYKQLEWVLLEAHSNLLEILCSSAIRNEQLIAQRCQRLSALLFYSTIPQNDHTLALHENTCQKLVDIQPGNSHSIYLLGMAQFAKYENSRPGEMTDLLLQDAKSSFQASIALEGKSSSDGPPDVLLGQQWWKDKVKAEEAKKKVGQEAANPQPTKPAAGTKAGPPGRGGAARGAPAARARGAPAAASRGGARGGVARGAGTARGGATAPPQVGKVATPAAKTTVKPGANSNTNQPHSCEPSSTTGPENTKTDGKTDVQVVPKMVSSLPAKVNRKSHHPRLGLARAHKSANEISESQKFYNEVITMAPEVHDAYIELADMIVMSDPLSAVDVYSKFPISDPPTFDDAFIIGEIVRILMKEEKYDDKKLGPNMISLGRVYGLGVLEKYVAKLEDKFKYDLLKSVYAGVNNKDIEDPGLQAFFKHKCWL
ncbi:hypothetical protein ScPMuIL_013514 [Solemya velum]